MAAIGKLRKRITIYDRTDAEAGAYSASTTRTNPRTVWCKVDNVSGTQQIDSRNAGTGVSHRMTIRHRSDITMRQQILYGGKFYDIKTVQMMDEDRKQFMVLECLQSETQGSLDDYQSPEFPGMIIVSGAGTSAVNGEYEFLEDESAWNKGTDYAVEASGSYWFIIDYTGELPSNLYRANKTNSVPPKTGWSVVSGGGTNPVPMLAYKGLPQGA